MIFYRPTTWYFYQAEVLEILRQMEETNPVAYSSPELILFRALREVTDYLHHLSQHLNVEEKYAGKKFTIKALKFSVLQA